MVLRRLFLLFFIDQKDSIMAGLFHSLCIYRCLCLVGKIHGIFTVFLFYFLFVEKPENIDLLSFDYRVRYVRFCEKF